MEHERSTCEIAVNDACAVVHYLARENHLLGPGTFSTYKRAVTLIATGLELLNSALTVPAGPWSFHGEFFSQGFPVNVRPQLVFPIPIEDENEYFSLARETGRMRVLCFDALPSGREYFFALRKRNPSDEDVSDFFREILESPELKEYIASTTKHAAAGEFFALVLRTWLLLADVDPGVEKELAERAREYEDFFEGLDDEESPF